MRTRGALAALLMVAGLTVTAMTGSAAYASASNGVDRSHTGSASSESLRPVWDYYASYTDLASCISRGEKGYGGGLEWEEYQCYYVAPSLYDLYVNAWWG
ncbi:hypothetical protein AAH979_42710 [Plantactinospora sp. ZYX-F-223]|uniref:hypothetical protein n=1 Tax=Plantactinospora sp. ZYX-F-223 TaxID=3144103 RepID=UPI0031FBB58E